VADMGETVADSAALRRPPDVSGKVVERLSAERTRDRLAGKLAVMGQSTIRV